LTGTPDNLLLLQYTEDLSPTEPGETRIAFLNTLPDVPTIDLVTGNGDLPGIQRIYYGDPPVMTTIPAQSLSFFMSGNNTQDENAISTVEQASNLEFHEGISYLYLITGQVGNPPTILSREVGILGASDRTESVVQTSTSEAQVRFINAIVPDTPVDFVINGSPLLSGLSYGQGSQFMPVTEHSASITINSTGGTTLPEAVDTTFEDANRYTVVAYSTGPQTIELLVIPDSGLYLDSGMPHLRLINVSPEHTMEFGLAFSEAPEEAQGVSTPTFEPQPDLRRSIPFGVFRIMNNIGGGSASNAVLMPQGTFDVSILDSAVLQIGATVKGVPLGENTHYDIVAYEEVESQRILAFAVPYPT
jgi:hypothetical protein